MYKENDIITIDGQKSFAEIAQYCNDNGLFLDSQGDNRFIVRSRRYYITRDMEIRILRNLRESECFMIVNQNFVINGKSYSWFDTLTDEQKVEANDWVQAWRDVTDKYVEGIDINTIIPQKPSWLK